MIKVVSCSKVGGWVSRTRPRWCLVDLTVRSHNPPCSGMASRLVGFSKNTFMSVYVLNTFMFLKGTWDSRRFMKRWRSSMNAAADKSRANSKWIALVVKQIKMHRYHFIIGARRRAQGFIWYGPAKSMPVWENDADWVMLASGRLHKSWGVTTGRARTQATHLKICVWMSCFANKTQNFWPMAD